jgi:NAD(P)-dependent dehydrogenase (short-subunit alcohol dehydrogenase family)
LRRGITLAFDKAGAPVVAVARDHAALAELAAAGAGIRVEAADAAREEVASELIGRYQPEILVLVAGAVPVGLPLHEHTWETFSVHWHADVKIAFGWLKAALLAPLRPGSGLS